MEQSASGYAHPADLHTNGMGVEDKLVRSCSTTEDQRLDEVLAYAERCL